MASRDDIGAMPPRPERSVAGLFGDLARETSRLFRQEIALAKAELMSKVGQLGIGAVEMAVGGFVIYTGFLGLAAAAGIALALVLPDWLAAIIIGVILLIIGAIVVLKGRHDLGPGNLVPDRTLRTLRDDAEWAREQMR